MNKIEKLIDYLQNVSGRHNCLYTPIVIDGKVLTYTNYKKDWFTLSGDYDGIRSHSNQFRFDYIDVKDKTVVDLGCNNGYSSFIFAENGAKRVVAIEKELHIGKTLELVADIKDLPNVETYVGDWNDYFKENDEVFDVAVFTSIFNNSGVLNVLDSSLLSCAKTWYVEPTNHTDNHSSTMFSTKVERFELSTEEIKEWGEKELSKYGEVEFLTFTDYQSRGLFKLVVE